VVYIKEFVAVRVKCKYISVSYTESSPFPILRLKSVAIIIQGSDSQIVVTCGTRGLFPLMASMHWNGEMKLVIMS
jgi:hypothetical protein